EPVTAPHLAVIFEIAATRIENSHGLVHARGALARRMTESREGQHRNARLVSEPARHTRRFDGNIRDVLRLRHFGYRGIGDHDRLATRENERDADDAVPGLR